MRLTDGQTAPDFTVNDVKGNPVSLSTYKNQYVLLSFFRYAGCPFCNITLMRLIERYDNFSKRGLQTVAFFQSNDESIDTYVSARNPPFPVVADPDKTIYNQYGVESSVAGAAKSLLSLPATVVAMMKGQVVQGKIDGDGFLMPAQFIIGPDSTVVKAHYGTSFADKIPLFEIEELILTKITH